MRELHEKMLKNADVIVARMQSNPTFLEEFTKDPKMALGKMDGLDIPEGWVDMTIARAKQEYSRSMS